MLFSARRRAAPIIQRMLSAVRRSGRTSTGTWYVEPPTRRDLTSTAGLQLSTAALKSFRASCLARSSIVDIASYMIRSAVLFLPPYIIMLTNFATRRLPCFGSGKTSRRVAPARRILASAPLRLLGAVLGAALLAARHAGRIERPPDEGVPDTAKVLHAAAANEHDRVFLQVMPHPRNVRGHLEPVGKADASDLPQRRVRLLRRRRVHANAHAALLRTGLHGGRFRLLRHRLATLPHQLTDGRHDSPF